MRRALVMLAFLCAFLGAGTVQASDRYAKVVGPTLAPIGWIGFCKRHPAECTVPTLEMRAIVLTDVVWKDLVYVNKWANDGIKPLSDQAHWGVEEKWSYPDDGYGDCEDYVLLKRRALLNAGFPRQALLITLVENQGEVHAVLTVKTDRGDFVLDNYNEDVRLWTDTGYRFIKRQSQEDPDVWVSLADPRNKKVASRR